MKGRIHIIALTVIAILVVVGASVASGSTMPAAVQGPDRVLSGHGGLPTKQLMVRFSVAANKAAMDSAQQESFMAGLSQAAGEELTYVRPMSGGAHVLAVADARPPADMYAMSARLEALPEIEHAEPDLIKTIDRNPATAALAVDLSPNDPEYSKQWHYKYVPGSSEGLNLPPAWTITTGQTDTVVAVIDTGILNHPDLSGKVLPGYDMITSISMANDGNGRDGDPSDPGDWVAAGECGANPDYPSSWHGTHVAGTIGAATHNSVGVAGVNWNAKILPVRVLGKCGGTTSDIIDAVRWAAGLSVTGVTANLNPADVINLSLGGFGPCGSEEQSAFDDAVAAGATVVIAAGNNNTNAVNYSPGNCSNIITVAATERTGDRAYYSNYGSVIEVSAPGGETATKANGVLSTLNDGAQGPGNHIYAFYQGTSMATPHVAGLASLVKGQHPSWTQAQVLDVLQTWARPFPAGSDCTTSICGAGIVDAYRTLFYGGGFEPSEQVYLPLVTARSNEEPVTVSIPNGDFEQGATIWSEYSTHGWPLIMTVQEGLSIAPRGGQYAVWLGGDDDETAYIQQSLKVPANAPYFTYWHWIISDDDCGYDLAVVVINSSQVADVYDLCATESTNDWVKHSADLSAWAGQTVAIQIRVEIDEYLVSSLFVDDVTFESSAAPDTGPAAAPQSTQRFTRP